MSALFDNVCLWQLDLRQVDYVVALARHGNFTRVVEDLHVAQPAVSQSIRTIERRIGLDVFDRKARRMTAATPMSI